MLATTKWEIDSNRIIVGDFITPLTPMNRSSGQKINKETQALNHTLDQKDLMSYSGHSIPKQICFFCFNHVQTEHSRGQITSWVTNQASVNLRKLNSY